MQKIVVIGGGTMGLDIAQVFARKSFDVVVRDIKDELIQASRARLVKGLDKLVAKGKMDEAKKADILAHITFTTDLQEAADADLVVEAATENPTIKKGIFTDLDGICKPETILASNTSSISITAIAAATKRPEKVLGMHFFNPAPAMKLVEVIRLRQGDRQEPRRGRRGSRFRGQPHPVPHDQRGHHRPGERHRLQGGHRHRYDVRC